MCYRDLINMVGLPLTYKFRLWWANPLISPYLRKDIL